MKAFQFRLQRVLEWRWSRVEQEKLALQALLLEQRSIEERIEIASQAMRLRVEESISGDELAGFAHYQDRLRRELGELAIRRPQVAQRIQQQQEALTIAHRESRLLERLKQERHAHWQSEFDKEIEDLASESFLSRWSPEG